MSWSLEITRNDIDQKQYEQEDLKKEIRKNLDSDEFKLLKEITAEYDNLKKTINKLKVSHKFKEQALSLLDETFYFWENTEQKLILVKKLNEALEFLSSKENVSISDIKEVIEKYWNFKTWFQESIALIAQLSFVLIILSVWIVMVSTTMWWLALFGWIVWLLGSVAYTSHENSVVTDPNKFFDMINDVYPDISEKEFKELFELYKSWKFDFDKFKKLMDKYYEDGRISYEERDELLKILKK